MIYFLNDIIARFDRFSWSEEELQLKHCMMGEVMDTSFLSFL